MGWKTWVLALALVCIIEGLVPFAAPEKWLDSVREIGRVARPEDLENEPADAGSIFTGVFRE